jgi:hypothetical protein
MLWATIIQLRDIGIRTGASRVFIFDHTIRRQPKDVRTPQAQLRGPVRRVHIDQSYSASVSRVPHHLPDEAEELLKHRFQIINVRSLLTALEFSTNSY